MAFQNNVNSNINQRGVPPTNQPPPINNQGRRRPRPRDVERMRAFNDVRHFQRFGEGGGWADEAQNEEAYQNASARVRPPPPVPRAQQGQRNTRPPPTRRGPPPVTPSTVSTPARDEPLYEGNNRGSKPVKKTLAHNMDNAGFIPLVRQVYDRMAVEDPQLARKLPYCIFQHAMVELLCAYQLHQAKYMLKAPELQNLMDPLAAIAADECNIPVPIFDYICGIGPMVTPPGDKVYWNLPSSAIPASETTHNNRTVRAGSFGPITSANHNLYECYISPYVTSEYIKRTANHPASSRRYDWNPFPPGWFPTNGVPNENLLGYRDIHRLHPDATRKCVECEFDESDTITGRLCHSAYAMNLTSGVLGTLRSIKVTRAEFKSRDNSSAFVFKEREEGVVTDILWDEPATLKYK